jgi:hypothetical protein
MDLFFGMLICSVFVTCISIVLFMFYSIKLFKLNDKILHDLNKRICELEKDKLYEYTKPGKYGHRFDEDV